MIRANKKPLQMRVHLQGPVMGDHDMRTPVLYQKPRIKTRGGDKNRRHYQFYRPVGHSTGQSEI